MHNPFAHEEESSLEELSNAEAMFSPLADCELGSGPTQSIRGRMFAALSSAANASVASHSRLGIASLAVFGPLLAVSAVGAATGDSPVEAPVTLLQSAAASVGIGGESGEVRQDFEVRAETAGDAGQPGSLPGNTANAPGLSGLVQAAEEEAQDDDGETPLEGEGEGAIGDEGEEAVEKLAPHENGKGCDDVLFAAGEPPFASPGGPVGCEVGNSGEHRQNGAKNDDEDDGEEPAPEPEEEAVDEDEEDASNGGVSRGLGRGHDEDKPGNGNGFGHDTHDHEPNTNGHGPGANDDGEEEPEEPAAPVTEPSEPITDDTSGGETTASNGPGNSGNANGNGNGRNR